MLDGAQQVFWMRDGVEKEHRVARLCHELQAQWRQQTVQRRRDLGRRVGDGEGRERQFRRWNAENRRRR